MEITEQDKKKIKKVLEDSFPEMMYGYLNDEGFTDYDEKLLHLRSYFDSKIFNNVHNERTQLMTIMRWKEMHPSTPCLWWPVWAYMNNWEPKLRSYWIWVGGMSFEDMFCLAQTPSVALPGSYYIELVNVKEFFQKTAMISPKNKYDVFYRTYVKGLGYHASSTPIEGGSEVRFSWIFERAGIDRHWVRPDEIKRRYCMANFSGAFNH